jgi:hypothetical protein
VTRTQNLIYNTANEITSSGYAYDLVNWSTDFGFVFR